ncbi:MAG: hypothetical protein CVU60_03295 [Deltaproteobacteria bacterium HGW-Deltaproteobacteria-18]|nr:MAG: hypothetical protein CVU60_03295 [Deltaproteobacteria bacterium HGW-Deltaproteobacteria-18]
MWLAGKIKKPAGQADYVSKKSQELKIVKIKQALQSPPCAATGSVAFAHTDICMEDKSFRELSSADAHDVIQCLYAQK